MIAAIEPRTITITLTTEPDPLFDYGQRLTLKQGTGKVIGREFISSATRAKFEEPEHYAPAPGWHYSFEFDHPGRVQGPIELFSEARLLAAIA